MHGESSSYFSAKRAAPIWIALLLALITFIIHARSPVLINTDSQWSLYVSQSIVRERNIDLDEYRERVRALRAYGVRKIDGHLYNYFPLGPSLAALPFVWLFETAPSLTSALLPGVTTSSGESSVLKVRRPMERAIASWYIGAATFLLTLTLLRICTLGWSVAFAALFAFGTSAWSMASRGLWQHAPALFFLSLGLWAIVRLEQQESHSSRLHANVLQLLAGLAFGGAYITRPTAAIMILGAGLFLIHRHRLSALWFVAGVLATLLPFIMLNLSLFHGYLPPYYRPHRLARGGSTLEGLAGTLFSPQRGLLVFSPWIVFCIFGARIWWRKDRALALFLIAMPTLLWLVVSRFSIWWGGHSFGPRLMTEALPFLILLVAPVGEAISRLRPPLRWIGNGLLTLTMIAAVMIHARGALRGEVHQWNRHPADVDRHRERLWNFRDWQVLR